MKSSLFVVVLAIVSAINIPSAAGQSKPSQEGKIVNVNKQNVSTPAATSAATNPNRMICPTHCPLIITSQYRIAKKVMYLNFPGEPVRMEIVRHKVSQADA